VSDQLFAAHKKVDILNLLSLSKCATCASLKWLAAISSSFAWPHFLQTFRAFSPILVTFRSFRRLTEEEGEEEE